MFSNHFSVPSPNQQTAASRVVVTHIGEDSGAGIWQCSKDPVVNCLHINTACHYLQKVIQVDPNATDDSVDINALLDYAGMKLYNKLCRITDLQLVSRVRRASQGERAVSYLTPPPPL